MAASLDNNIDTSKPKSRKHVTSTILFETTGNRPAKNETREDVLLQLTNLRFTGKRITKMESLNLFDNKRLTHLTLNLFDNKRLTHLNLQW